MNKETVSSVCEYSGLPSVEYYSSREITIEDIRKIHQEMSERELGYMISTSDGTTEWTTEIRDGVTVHQSKPKKDI